MAINFNSLPADKPNGGFALIPEGQYLAKIIKAEMKQPVIQTKPQYLSLTIECTNKKNEKAGLVFDNVTESTAPLPMYKLKRLLSALELPMGDTFELVDLTKIVCNKPFLVDICTGKYKDKEQSQVDINKEIYYPLVDGKTPAEIVAEETEQLTEDMEETF